MNALDIKSRRQLNDQVENAASAKKGCLTWEEFLNYFFLRNATFEDRIDGNDWWTRLDQNGAPVIEEIPVDKTISGVFDDDLLDDKENEGENRDSVIIEEITQEKDGWRHEYYVVLGFFLVFLAFFLIVIAVLVYKLKNSNKV